MSVIMILFCVQASVLLAGILRLGDVQAALRLSAADHIGVGLAIGLGLALGAAVGRRVGLAVLLAISGASMLWPALATSLPVLAVGVVVWGMASGAVLLASFIKWRQTMTVCQVIGGVVVALGGGLIINNIGLTYPLQFEAAAVLLLLAGWPATKTPPFLFFGHQIDSKRKSVRLSGGDISTYFFHLRPLP